ncbi:MAG: response regulator transcription factor [Halobacteriaceae archaeon]
MGPGSRGSERPSAFASDGGADVSKGTGERGTVLVADDDEALAETVDIWLGESWDTVFAHDGDAAVEAFGPRVDVALLDRRMPTRPGGEVLGELRECEGDAPVAIVTAVAADWEAVELPFDLYLEKPVDRAELVGAVERLYARTECSPTVRTLLSVAAKLGALRARYPLEDLRVDERYGRLRAEFDRLYRRSGSDLPELASDDADLLARLVDDPPR